MESIARSPKDSECFPSGDRTAEGIKDVGMMESLDSR
jgi:hypothetical protein